LDNHDVTQIPAPERFPVLPEEEFRMFFELSNDAQLLIVNGRIVNCNNAAVRMFGFARDDIIGRNLADLSATVMPDASNSQDQIEKLLDITLREGGNLFEWNFHRIDSSEFPADVLLTPFHIAGEIIFQATVRDIRERKKTGDELEQARKHFQYLNRVSNVIAQSPDLDSLLWNVMQEVLDILQVDRVWMLYPCDPQAPCFQVPLEVVREGHPGAFIQGIEVPANPGTVAVMSDALATTDPVIHDLFRWKEIPETALQFNIKTQIVIALHPKIDKPWLLGMHQCSHNREWTADDIRLFRDVAERITYALTNRLLLKQLQDDIVRRERTEAELARRQSALELSNSELESYSYSIAHDLRSPLRTIIGFSQILLEDSRDNLNAGELKNLNRIVDAGKNMAQLIDDILDLSRITRCELSYEDVNLGSLGDRIITNLKQTQPVRNIHWMAQSNITVKGDPRLLELALRNLIDNAWKYTRDKIPAKIELGTTRLNNEIVYYVQDNGVGFDMAYKSKLFKPFQRLHTSDDFEGTGVGLATVKRIYNDMEVVSG